MFLLCCFFSTLRVISSLSSTMFTHLHLHSHYSLLEAIGSPKGYLQQANTYGMHALALTDYGGMYGAIEFYQAAKKIGIQPILWVELGYVQDMSRKDPGEQTGTIVLLAKSYTGYEQLLQLISEAHLTWFHKIPRIDFSCLSQHHTDLIALSGWVRSWIGKKILQQESAEIMQEHIEQMQRTLWADNHVLMRCAQEHPQGDTHLINQTLFNQQKTRGIPMIVSGDVHYVDREDKHIYETALAIKDSKRIYDADRRRVIEKLHLQSEDELRTWMNNSELWDQSIEALFDYTNTIASTIAIEIPLWSILFPIYETPKEIKNTYDARQATLIHS